MSVGCCAEYVQESISVTVSTGPVTRPLDRCGDKANFTAVAGEIYEPIMPVTWGPNPGEVIPAPTGVDAIGVALGSLTAVGGEALLVQRTGHVFWSDMAAAIGADPLDAAAWWPIHQELAKANV